MPAKATPELPILQCASAQEWERWLDEHHARAPEAWLKIAKRGAASTTVSHAEALEVAICFGWIDGQVRRLDDSFFLRRFTPRGPRSRWSQVNRATADRLTAEGRMRPAGAAQVRAAQADGRWEAAYEPQRRATVPEDFQRALAAEPAAAAFFQTLKGSRRYAFLYRLHHVTSPEARGRRIARYIELLREGRTLN